MSNDGGKQDTGSDAGWSNVQSNKDFIIQGVKPLQRAKESDLTFFDSAKYKSEANTTKAKVCITTTRSRTAA